MLGDWFARSSKATWRRLPKASGVTGATAGEQPVAASGLYVLHKSFLDIWSRHPNTVGGAEADAEYHSTFTIGSPFVHADSEGILELHPNLHNARDITRALAGSAFAIAPLNARHLGIDF